MLQARSALSRDTWSRKLDVSPWGLLRHYWVLISLVATGLALTVLVLHIPAVMEMARTARDADADVTSLDGDLVHPSVESSRVPESAL